MRPLWQGALTALFLLYGVAVGAENEVRKAHRVKCVDDNFALAESQQGSVCPEKFSTSVDDALNRVSSSIDRLSKNYLSERPLPTYQSFLIAFGALGFLISIVNVLLTIWHKVQDRKSSVVDNFWLREVIIPKALKPLDDNVLENKFRFSNHATLDAGEVAEFIKSLDELKYQISIAMLISPKLMSALEEELDRLGLVIVERAMPTEVYNHKTSAVEQAGDPFLECYKSLVSHFMTAHHSLKLDALFEKN